ncbi:MAG: Glycosyl transferase family 2, partial [Candidatus Woesebacteria bacterium GW2011_GWA1_39_12]
MKIWAHTLVRNEERYLWFSVMSVIDYIDKMLIWDTGSTDNTVKIIQEIKKKYPGKIDFMKVGKVDAQKFTKVRQEMLDITKSDWFLIVDGDEVWWDGGISKVTQIIRKHGNNLETIVNGYFNIIGDIYHY